MIRVTFDRSAFHGQNFERLQHSQLEAVCRRGIIQVFHTPVFLEETFDMFAVEANREELRRQLPFILRIANGGMFRTIREIWHDELVQNRGPNVRLLWTQRERREFEERIQHAPLKSDAWGYWAATAGERDDKQLKKNNQKEAYRDAREGLTARLRANGHQRPLSSYQFADHLASELDLYGRTIIGSQIPSKNTLALQNQWSRNKKRYPFVTGFVEGFAYAGYYAAIKQNSPLDRNAQADYEQMTYLRAADILVSADTRFLSEAFDALWKPRGKVLMSPDHFIEFISRL